MSRVPRKSLNSKYFHVIVQGLEKKYIFKSRKLKEKYMKLILNCVETKHIEILAYCIMDNHAHFLLYVENINDLSSFMQNVNTSYALYYNKSNNRVGYLFRDRFRSIAIMTEKQLYRTLIYIHLNPVKAYLCSKPEFYEFSSYKEYVNMFGVVNENVLKRMKFSLNNYKCIFEFMHICNVEGEEFDKKNKKQEDFQRIKEYIETNKIKDIIFQSEKIRKMVDELKKEKISITRISEFLEISTTKLKRIIYEE